MSRRNKFSVPNFKVIRHKQAFFMIRSKSDNNQFVKPDPKTMEFKLEKDFEGAWIAEEAPARSVLNELNEKFGDIFELVNTNKYLK